MRKSDGSVPAITGAALILGLIVSFASLSGDARAQAVAMVTDVQGSASAVSAGERRNLSILSDITENTEVTIAQGARLVAVFLRSGEEYTFSGPALARFSDAGPQTLSGAAPSRRPSALEKGRDIRIRPVGVTQAVIVLRSAKPGQRIRLLTLAGTRTLDTQPEFRWQPIAGVKRYRFELADGTGKALLEMDVDGESLRLPATVSLQEGQSYTWEVSTRLSDGRKYASSGDFSVLPAARREEVEALRPSSAASLAERVAFAAWLEQQELRDEARRYWRDAAAERPEDAHLRALAAQ